MALILLSLIPVKWGEQSTTEKNSILSVSETI